MNLASSLSVGFCLCVAVLPTFARGQSGEGSAGKIGLTSAQVLHRLDGYNVRWDTPSHDATGSMPIGNGILGANVWVDEQGVIHLLLARTDTWSEISRLLKLGEVRISLSPNPFTSGFGQELRLQDGAISLSGQGVWLKIGLDPNRPVLVVSGQSDQPMTVSASLGSWRTARREISGEEANSAWTMKDGPIKLFESGDHEASEAGNVMVYHRNESSCVDFSLNWQGLLPFKDLIGDPILHRTFGTLLSGPGLESGSKLDGELGGELRSRQPVRQFSVQITTACGTYPSAAEFVTGLRHEASETPSAAEVLKSSAAWWHKFWNRSYVFVTAPSGASAQTEAECFHITQSYVLQRFMMAAAGRGADPLKFNGSIFTVAPTWFGKKFNPDWRRWGDGYWWQNTRLPYWAMVANGDFDDMEPLFNMYQSILALSEARTQLYYKAKGAYFPETISFFGTYAGSDYGWDRKPGQAPGDFDAEWWKYAWNQGPELVQMMLDRYEAKPNAPFLKKQLLPMARKVVLFFDTFFPRDEEGRLKLTPDQVIETYRNGVTNDTPCIAGLHAILPRLLSLPGLSPRDRALYQGLDKILPPIAVKDGRIMPAQTFSPERFNVENGEFYAIWPFRQYGMMQGDVAIAATTYQMREIKDDYGWQYDGQTAALAGLTQEARADLLSKIKNSNSHFRFPAMWGPNYDWLPDQTHGGNILLTLQSMLLQSGNLNQQIAVCPAFPREWNVDFKLYATAGKLVLARQRNGKVYFQAWNK